MSNEQRRLGNPQQYLVGDVVSLVAGGPKMTVNVIEPPYTVQCVWFEVINTAGGKTQYGDLKTGRFAVHSLKLIEESETSKIIAKE